MLHFTAHRGLLVLTLFFPVDTDIVVGRLYLGRAAVDAVVNGRKILVGNNFLTLSNTKIAGVAILCDDCLRRGESRRYL